MPGSHLLFSFNTRQNWMRLWMISISVPLQGRLFSIAGIFIFTIKTMVSVHHGCP